MSHYYKTSNNGWVPNYLNWYGWDVFSEINQLWMANSAVEKNRTVHFCYSNPEAKFRNAVAVNLGSRGILRSSGQHLNNLGTVAPFGLKAYGDFISRDKVVMAFENDSFLGYCTEKLISSIAGGGRVLYWGDPSIDAYVNREIVYNVTGLTVNQTLRVCDELLSFDGVPDGVPLKDPFKLCETARNGIRKAAEFIVKGIRGGRLPYMNS